MSVYIQDAQPNIILLGDIMLDHTINGTSLKIANEAPIPVINSKNEKYSIGGCGNVLMNMLSLGANQVFLFGKIGNDMNSKQLLNILPPVENCMIIDSDYITTTKHRIYSNNKLMCRYDNEIYKETSKSEEDNIICSIDLICNKYNISSLIFSDYNKGFLTETLCNRVILLCKSYNIPTIVDPKKDYNKYIGCTVIKPNRMETLQIFKIDIKDTGLENAHKQIHNTVKCTASVITLSEDGISAYSDKLYYYKDDVKDVIDVTGAGDIVCSVLGVYYPFISDINLLIKIASNLATISIGHVGVYTITDYDLLQTYHTIHNTKLLSVTYIDYIKQPIIFTNGCFDVVHSAHIALFAFCKKIGGVVIVGLNSDSSIKRLKGLTRPINCLEDRIKILDALESVDFIIPFEEDTPLELLKRIKPDYLVKGGDYTKDTIIGRDYAKEVVIFKYIQGKSTTNIIKYLYM